MNVMHITYQSPGGIDVTQATYQLAEWAHQLGMDLPPWQEHWLTLALGSEG